MRKEWISYGHMQVRKAEQKSERKRLGKIKDNFTIKNPSNRHFYSFYWKFYMFPNKRRTVNYLW